MQATIEQTTQQEATINIADLLPWSEPKRIETRNGPRMLRKADPDDKFWAAWRGSKQALKDAGISVGNRDGQWEVCWWQMLDAKVVEAEKKAVEASRATDAEVDLPCPTGLSYLPYQRAGIAAAVRWMRDGKVGVLIGDEMGLGKTIQAIGIANAEPSIRKVLVVCPASLKLNWKREFEKWSTTGLRCGLATSKFWPGDAVEVVIVNYDILKQCRERLMETTWDLLIADECHFMKNPKAQRTQFLLGSKAVEPVKARFRAYLTGTPIVNRPKEMFGLINSLDRKTFPSFWAYGKRYCGETHNGFGWDFSGASNLDELQHKLRASCMIRRLKKDVLTELPPKRRQVIELPAEGRLANLVAQEWEIREKAEERLGEIRTKIELAKCAEDLDGYAKAVEELKAGEKAAFEEGAVVAHEIAMAKVPDVIAHVREAIEEGKVILFAHHLDVIDAYKEEFGAECVVVDGRVKIEDRQAAVDRFQTDPSCRVFIGGMKAAGVGLTLTASSHVVFGEIDWVPGNMSQAEDRAHRIGQTDSVLVQMMVLEGSLDAHKIRTLIRKMEVIDQALDRRHATGAPQAGTNPEAVRVTFAERKERARRMDAAEPVDGVKRETVSWEELDAEAEKITDEQVARIHEGLQILAGMCDGAREIDGAGFNKFDTRTGKALAYQCSLTKRQALLGRKLVNKYRGQLGIEFARSCGCRIKGEDN